MWLWACTCTPYSKERNDGPRITRKPGETCVKSCLDERVLHAVLSRLTHAFLTGHKGYFT
eukprot:3696-Eustigmatos_ZCMA.PRE.1